MRAAMGTWVKLLHRHLAMYSITLLYFSYILSSFSIHRISRSKKSIYTMKTMNMITESWSDNILGPSLSKTYTIIIPLKSATKQESRSQIYNCTKGDSKQDRKLKVVNEADRFDREISNYKVRFILSVLLLMSVHCQMYD